MTEIFGAKFVQPTVLCIQSLHELQKSGLRMLSSGLGGYCMAGFLLQSQK